MSATECLVEANAVTRLRERDASLFSDDPEVQAAVANRLGWTDLSAQSRHSLARIQAIAAKAREDGVEDVVLLGMGGSSLASLVLSRVLGTGSPTLHVLDTVSPVSVRRVLDSIDPARTLHIVASKSGGTIEPNALYSIFRRNAENSLGDAAGKRFIAITDPGSSLERLAREQGFAEVVGAPPTVGGRFSAISEFGLLPAALIGLDLEVLLQRAAAAEEDCAASPEANPAVELAAFISDALDEGADKLSFVAPSSIRSFGLWAEQLVAESLGKHGMGIVPVVELADTPLGYGPDRAIVVFRMTGDRRLAEWAAAQRGRHPVYEIVLDDPYDVAEEFVRWEHAVALAGFLLGINPFDEPNVAEAKAATGGVLDGSVEVPKPSVRTNEADITFAGGLVAPDHHEHSAATAFGHAVASLEEGDYLAILAYMPDDDELLAPLFEAVPGIATETGAAVCLELGPRYLHSTGQLHKGGPNKGVFVLLTNQDVADVEVPGQEWGLRTLHRAQAEGDLLTLVKHGRRVLWLDLPDASKDSIEALAGSLMDGAGVVREVNALR